MLCDSLRAFVEASDALLRSMEGESVVLFGRLLANAPVSSQLERQPFLKAASLLELSPDEQTVCAQEILNALAPRLRHLPTRSWGT